MEICQTYYDLVIGGHTTQAAKYFVKHNTTITKNMNEFFDTLCDSKKHYYYMVTFNLKPECVSKADEIDSYIRKQFTHRPALQIVDANISRELTKAGVDHWHVQVTTTTPLSKDRFDYYIKRYGCIDISKSYSQNPKNTLKYISKSTHVDQLTQVKGDSKDLTQESPQKPQKWDRSMFLDFD